MRILTLLALGVLAAAGTGCTSTDVKSGDVTHSYDCSGLGKGWGDCTQKAEAQCGGPRSYTTVSQKGDAEGKSTSGNTEMKRTLVVTCNGKAGG